MRWNRWRGVMGFALVLLLARTIFLAAALDPEEERVAAWLDAGELTWSSGPERPLYDREELYTGAAALTMRAAPLLPAHAFQFMPYGSGSLIVTRIAGVLFDLFGPTYQAFKLLPLLVSLVTGLCWFAVTRAWLGPRAAWAFGLLFVFAPSVLTRTLLIAKGDHAEAAMLIGAVCLCATRAIPAGSPRGRLVWSGAAGLLAGLGVAVTYSTVPVLAGIGLAALFITRARPRGVWLAGAAGLAIGLIPWAVAALGTQGEALRVYGRPLGSAVGVEETLRRLALLGRTGFFAAYDLPLAAVRVAAGFVWLAAVLSAWWGLASSARRRPLAALILAGTMAHLAAYLLAAPDASSRYLIPLYPLLLLAVVILFTRPGRSDDTTSPAGSAARPRSPLRLPWPILLLALIGCVAQLSVVATSGFAALRVPLRGYDHALLGEVLGSKLTPEGIRALPPGARRFAWVGRGRRLSRASDPSTWPAEIAAESNSEPIARVAAWEGVGVGLAESGRVSLGADLLPTLPDEDREALRRGLELYAEVFAVPLLRPGVFVDLASFARRFDQQERPLLNGALARALAVLEVQGVPLSRDRIGGVRSLIGPTALTEALEAAAGWAQMRTTSPGVVRWWWGPDRPLFTDPGSPPSGQDRGSAFWRGAAAAWRFHLQTRSPGWLVQAGGDRLRVTTDLARELERLVSAMPAAAADPFAEAAGLAAASAARAIVLHGHAGEAAAALGGGISEPILDAVPAALRPAFAGGWSAEEWR